MKKKIIAIITGLTIVAMVTPISTQALTAAELQVQIDALMAQLTTLQAQLADLTGEPAVTVTGCTITSFDRALKLGMTGDDVKCLQIVLNSASDTQLASSGVGSSGSETSYFGPLTKAAVIKFQEKYASEILASWGLTSGTGFVGSTTRAKLDSLLGAIAEEEEEEEEPLPTDEFLKVALSADTPAAGVVPYGAQFIAYTKFDMSAGLEDVVLTSITVTRTGLGRKGDIDKVWFQVGDEVVSNHKAVASDQTAVLALSSYTIPAGETKTFTLYANLEDTAANASNIDAFQITSADDITADETATGSFPIAGNSMTISSYVIADVTLAQRGSATTVDVGTEETVIGEFSLRVDSENNQDGLFKSIRFKQVDSAKLSNIDNIGLYKDGVKISTATLVSGSYVKFVIEDGYELPKGKTRYFEVRGDLTGGDDGDIIELKLNKAYDLEIYESGTTLGVIVSTGADVALNEYTLNAGKFTVSTDISTPGNKNYGVGTSDVVGLIAKMDLGQAVKVDALKLYLHTDSDISNGSGATDDATWVEADIENITLYVNDTFIDSLDDVSGTITDDGDVADDEIYYDFDTEFTLNDDDLIKISFDIKSTAATGNAYKFTFDKDDFTSPEYVSSGDSILSADKAGTATSNTATITAASVTLTRNDGYVDNESFVAGTKGAKLIQFLINAGNASSIALKTINFDFASLATGEYTMFTGGVLKIDGEQVGSTKDCTGTSTGTTATITFDGLNEKIVAGGQATMAFYIDIDAGTAATDNFTVTFDDTDSRFEDDQGDTISDADEASPNLDIIEAGSLVISLDGDTPDNAILRGGSTDVEVARFRFTAAYDAVNITDLYFANNYTDGSTGDSGTDARISALKLYVGGELITGGSRALSDGKVHYDLGTTNAIQITKNTYKVLVAKVDLNAVPISTALATSTNQRVLIELYAAEAESASTGSALASITNVEVSDTGIGDGVRPEEFVITADAPTVLTGSVATTNLVNGSANYIYSFSISANSASGVAVKKILFDVTGAAGGSGTALDDLENAITFGGNATDITSGVKIWRGSTDLTSRAAIDITVSKTISVVFDDAYIQSIGTTPKTYKLQATLTGFTGITNVGGGNSITTKIKEVSDYVAANTYATAASGSGDSGDGTGTLIWCDNSGTANDVDTKQWMNDKYVSGLETEGITLILQ